jgi:hypothetical protein
VFAEDAEICHYRRAAEAVMSGVIILLEPGTGTRDELNSMTKRAPGR